MKKLLSILCASMLCVCCLALAACGGDGNSSSNTNSISNGSSSSSSSAPSTANPADKFVGDWQLAAVETSGITMSGDISQLLGEDTSGILISIKKDGTGSMSFAGETADITWTLNGDNAITVTPDQETSTITTAPVIFEDNALKMEVKDEELTVILIFTPDGSFAGAKTISSSNAKAITSEDALIGEWHLSGVSMMGVSMYGDAKDLASVIGDEESVVMTFEKGGKANAFGAETTWTVGADGAAITESDIEIPVKSLDDDIIIDAGAAFGDNVEVLMVFAK